MEFIPENESVLVARFPFNEAHFSPVRFPFEREGRWREGMHFDALKNPRDNIDGNLAAYYIAQQSRFLSEYFLLANETKKLKPTNL